MVTSLAAPYLNWGVIQISLTNFLIVVAMVVVFALAVLVPFPSSHDDAPEPADPGAGRHDAKVSS